MSRYTVTAATPLFRATESALARERCSCIKRRKPSSSTLSPCSAAISRVRSIGNPKVSCRANAESPLSTLVLVDFKSAAARSNIDVPRSSVLRNVSSSAAAIDMMRPCSVNNSGYCGAIAVMLAAISSFIDGSCVPSNRILRTTRRKIRRKT